MMNFYTVYRWVLFGFTLYGTVEFIITVRKYKKFYDKTPALIKKYVVNKGSNILVKEVQKQKQDLIINGGLLGVLVSLNLIMFFV